MTVSITTQVVETAALAAAAMVTGASALIAQTFAAGADIAVQVFLVIGVRLSDREADETHPLGYGRERYFWSLFAAIAVFISGFAVAITQALHSALHPAGVSGYGVGYVVLAATLALESVPFGYALRETRRRAGPSRRSLRAQLRDTTEPATTTELIANGMGVAGAVLAAVALALTQATGSRWPEAIASGLIGIALMAAALALAQQNRDLLTGRGVSPHVLAGMRAVIAAEPGVIDVPDLLSIVIGPATVVVDGDVTLSDELSVPEAEAVIRRVAAQLESRWREVRYVYLTPVAERRPRRSEPD